MAAPLRQISQRVNFQILRKLGHIAKHSNVAVNNPSAVFCRKYSQFFQKELSSNYRFKLKVAICVASVSSVFAINAVKNATSAGSEHPVSRSVKGILDVGEQKFTLYQFQSCPYCCKVRATLDYFGFSYDVVEVNSLSKKQIKFSDYKKVPILVVNGKDGDTQFTVQFNDSTAIVSALGSYVYDPSTSLQKLQTYYPGFKEKEGRKTVWNCPNKYFIMDGENIIDKETMKQRKEERKWRRWTDDILMHTISPNVYRTLPESLEAFHHFSEWGEWEKNFSKINNLFIVYVGSLAMFIIGKIVKKRHNIADNPRDSLYDACNAWTKAVGNNKFLGINKPNMADISVYGALHSFEGCLAFTELMENHKVKQWYQNMEKELKNHRGSSLLTKQP